MSSPSDGRATISLQGMRTAAGWLSQLLQGVSGIPGGMGKIQAVGKGKQAEGKIRMDEKVDQGAGAVRQEEPKIMEGKMEDRKTVMSWLEGLTMDDWRIWYSDTEVQETAKAALELLKEQPEIIRCKDCEHYTGGIDGYCNRWFRRAGGEMAFCSSGARR